MKSKLFLYDTSVKPIINGIPFGCPNVKIRFETYNGALYEGTIRKAILIFGKLPDNYTTIDSGCWLMKIGAKLEKKWGEQCDCSTTLEDILVTRENPSEKYKQELLREIEEYRRDKNE